MFLRGFIASTIDVDQALERGHDLVNLEQRLHLSVEGSVQSTAMGIPMAIPLMNVLYIWGNVPLLIGILLWLRLKSPRWFTVLRNGLILSVIPSATLFLAVPTAPPRLEPGMHLADTVNGASHSHYWLQPGFFADHFAAVPSLHVGWALAGGLAMYLAMSSTRWRWLWLALPLAMAVTVMGTGNHYVLDWVTGSVIAAASFAAAQRWEERASGRRLSVEAEPIENMIGSTEQSARATVLGEGRVISRKAMNWLRPVAFIEKNER